MELVGDALREVEVPSPAQTHNALRSPLSVYTVSMYLMTGEALCCAQC